MDNPLEKIIQRSAGRRRFLQGTGIGAAGIATTLATSAITASPARAASGTGTLSDVDIFNFALNFEYLGSQYYLAALGAAPLPDSLTGKGKTTTGGGYVIKPSVTAVPFETSAVATFALLLAQDEYAHVSVIREVLGNAAVAQPVLDLESSWTNLAVAAGLITEGELFNPFESQTNFLLGAYILEDVCVTALTGAAAYINSPLNLAYAASILGVEGYQIGMIRGQLSAIGAGAATNAISNLRAEISHYVASIANPATTTVADDNGTDYNGNPFAFTNVDINGQAFRRTPQQVLGIAYGGEGPTGGGFFPAGVNGSTPALMTAY